MMVAIVFLSFFMLSAAFMMLSYRYIIAEKRDAMERNADYIASFTSEYIQQSGSLDVYFRSYVATLASVSDSNVLLSDVDGDIIYASGGSSSDLSNYTDSRIPQRVLQQVLSSGSYNGLTNLDGIYSEKRYLASSSAEPPFLRGWCWSPPTLPASPRCGVPPPPSFSLPL